MTTASVLSKSFAIVREDLHRLYGAACDAATIDSILDDVIAELSGSAKVTNFLPILAEREATERIKAESGCKDFAPRQEILFADSRGSGRSQIATALAYHLVGDGVFIRTIGLNPEDGLNPRVVAALRDRGVEYADGIHACGIGTDAGNEETIGLHHGLRIGGHNNLGTRGGHSALS